MEKKELHYKMQVFAPDISEETIELGRACTYPDNIAVEVSKEGLGRRRDDREQASCKL